MHEVEYEQHNYDTYLRTAASKLGYENIFLRCES